MGDLHVPKPVKCFMGLLIQDRTLIEELTSQLTRNFGEIDICSQAIPFTFTDYYTEEMGTGLTRHFFSFRELIDPGALARIKVQTNAMEAEFAECHATKQVKRPCNLDPGYLDANKVVLASTKNYSHRIYLSQGIFAELTLQYQHKHFTELPWTYPDFKTALYQQFLENVRTEFLAQIKNQ